MIVSFWSRLLDLIAPRQCIVCERRLSVSEQTLCGVCNLHLPRTGYQLHPEDNPLARLFWGRIPIERATALFYYEAGAETTRIIHAMKYFQQPDIGVNMGRMMARELLPTGFFDGIDLLVPVPLAPKRQRRRGYNQSLMIARGISQLTGLPIADDAVVRTAFKDSQTHLGYQQRQDNVEHVFRLVNANSLHNRHVLLVDDIITTGATMTACAQQLLQADNVRISVASLGHAKTV